MTKKIVQKENNILAEIENVDVQAENVLSESDMVRMSNEETVLSRYDYPRLQFDGGKGVYLFNDKELTNVRMIMLKFRRHYGAFAPRNIKPSWVMWTEEVDNDNQNVDLFRKEDGGEVEKVANDYIYNLKKTFQAEDLKMQQDVYGVLVADNLTPQLCKISFKKTGVSAIFDYYKEFPYGEHIYNYVTHLGSRKIVNDRREEYFVPTFKKGRMLSEEREQLALKNAMLEIENAVRISKETEVMDSGTSDVVSVENDFPSYTEAPQDEFDRFIAEQPDEEEQPKIAKSVQDVQEQIRQKAEIWKNKGK